MDKSLIEQLKEIQYKIEDPNYPNESMSVLRLRLTRLLPRIIYELERNR